MVRHIDRGFLTDSAQYRHAEQFWHDLWKQIVEKGNVESLWQTPWLGAPLADGNPIFSAVAPTLKRGVHVIQHEPASNEIELVWWLDKFGEEGFEPVIDQLVISCALSREAAAEAHELLWRWVIRGQIDRPNPVQSGETQV